MSIRLPKKVFKIAKYGFLFVVGFFITLFTSGRSSNGSLLDDVNELIRVPIASADIPVGDTGSGDTGTGDTSGGDRDSSGTCSGGCAGCSGGVGDTGDTGGDSDGSGE